MASMTCASGSDSGSGLGPLPWTTSYMTRTFFSRSSGTSIASSTSVTNTSAL